MPRLTVVWKVNLMVLGGLALLLGTSVSFGILQTSDLGEQKVRLALTGAGTAAALVLDAQDVAALTPASAETPAYRRAEEALKRLAATFGLSDLYVVRPAGKTGGSWEFVFDTADGPFDEGGSQGGFSAYESPPEELVQAWSVREPVVTAQPYTDEYGTFRSAFLVLTDPSGTPRAVVGSDFNLGQLAEARNKQLVLSLVLALGGAGLLVGLAWGLGRMVDLPLSVVSRRFTALAEGTDDFSQHVTVHSKDELGDLAKGFNAFADKLGVLVADLRSGVDETARIQTLLQRDSEETAITLNHSRQGLEALTASGSLLESSIEGVLRNLEAISAQGTTLDSLARSQEETAGQVARDHGVLDQEVSDLRSQAHAVGRALDDLDRESAENHRRMEGEMAVLGLLGGEVEAVNGIVATLVNTAESTALLAMNASIEAAHAGVQGRGFAVIAQRMRQQAETSRIDADRIGQTLGRMVDLIGQASGAAGETSRGAQATHSKVETAQALVSRLTASGDSLEAFIRRNRQAIDSLREAGRGVAGASGAVAAGTREITESTRSLQEVSVVVLAGAETILEGSGHMAAVVDDIREIADRLTAVSRSLEENLRRLRSG